MHPKWLRWQCLGLVLAAFAGVANAADRPNVVILLVDDMGLMDTSAQPSHRKHG